MCTRPKWCLTMANARRVAHFQKCIGGSPPQHSCAINPTVIHFLPRKRETRVSIDIESEWSSSFSTPSPDHCAAPQPVVLDQRLRTKMPSKLNRSLEEHTKERPPVTPCHGFSLEMNAGWSLRGLGRDGGGVGGVGTHALCPKARQRSTHNPSP